MDFQYSIPFQAKTGDNLVYINIKSKLTPEELERHTVEASEDLETDSAHWDKLFKGAGYYAAAFVEGVNFLIKDFIKNLNIPVPKELSFSKEEFGEMMTRVEKRLTQELKDIGIKIVDSPVNRKGLKMLGFVRGIEYVLEISGLGDDNDEKQYAFIKRWGM
jgi:hypothetical protein